MAAAARKCAEIVGNRNAEAETAFAAGLLADLGMLVMFQLETEKYVELPFESDHLVELVKQEREVFGFDHLAVSQRLLTKWRLPAELIEAVANHHTYLPASAPLNHILLVANLLAEVLWMPHSPYMQPLQQVLSRQLGMEVDDLITLAVECKEAVLQSMEIFDVHLEGDIDLEALEQQARQQFELAHLETADERNCLEAFLDEIEAPVGECFET